MSEDQRLEWLKVARQTVGHLPQDLLAIGCVEARRTADHPAKIVPAIIRAAEPLFKLRRENNLADRIIPPERRIEPNYVDPDEAARILAEFNLPSIRDAKREAPRMPTAEDYRAMGIKTDLE